MLNHAPAKAHRQGEALVTQANVACDAARVAQEVAVHGLERIDLFHAARSLQRLYAGGFFRGVRVERNGVYVLDTRGQKSSAGGVERIVASIPGDTEALRQHSGQSLRHAKQRLLCL